MTIVRGRFVNGSSVVFKKENGKLIQGLEFAEGNQKWLNYEWIGCFYNDRAAVSDGEHMGYIDRMGIERIPLVYLSADDFAEGRAFVMQGTETLLIDTDGKIVREYGEVLVASEFKDGTAIVSRIAEDGEQAQDAVVDLQGNFIVDFAPYRTIRGLSDLHMEPTPPAWNEGLFRFRSHGKMVITDMYENILWSDEET